MLCWFDRLQSYTTFAFIIIIIIHFLLFVLSHFVSISIFSSFHLFISFNFHTSFHLSIFPHHFIVSFATLTSTSTSPSLLYGHLPTSTSIERDFTSFLCLSSFVTQRHRLLVVISTCHRRATSQQNVRSLVSNSNFIDLRLYTMSTSPVQSHCIHSHAHPLTRSVRYMFHGMHASCHQQTHTHIHIVDNLRRWQTTTITTPVERMLTR